MPERIRYNDLAPWIAAAIGLLAIGFSSYAVFYSKGYQAADQRHEAEYASRNASEKHYQECITKPTVDEALKCYQQAEHTNREAQRSEQDLNAQREMADWAEGMLWATLFVGISTTVITGIGVYWVRETLVATARFNEMQLRAYLLVSTVTADFVTLRGEIIAVDIKLVVKNGGQTPAMNVGHYVRVAETLTDPGPIMDDGSSFKSVVIALDAQLHRAVDVAPDGEVVIFDQQIGIEHFTTFVENNGRLNCNMSCRVHYKPVASKDVQYLILNYWIRREGGKTPRLRISRSGPNETT